MSSPRRGEVWLVDFGEPVGHEQGFRRPAVIVSSDRMNASRAGLAIVVPVTTKRRGLPSHVELDPAHTGLREVSYAKVEDIKSVSTERLLHATGRAPSEVLNRLARVITTLLELP